jgi:hypothetical protein
VATTAPPPDEGPSDAGFSAVGVVGYADDPLSPTGQCPRTECRAEAGLAAGHPQADESKETDVADETPVLDTLAAITAASVERCELDPRELMLTRIAALVAVDAPPASYLLNAGAASDVGVTLEDVQGVLIAVAPLVGTARVVSAAGNIARALGFAIAVAEAELEESEG